jgi:hypothetical protein
MACELMKDIPSTWTADSSRYIVHEYFSITVTECNHELSKEGQDACERNGDLSPGLDCCAVCAATHKNAKIKQYKGIVEQYETCRKCKKG